MAEITQVPKPGIGYKLTDSVLFSSLAELKMNDDVSFTQAFDKSNISLESTKSKIEFMMGEGYDFFLAEDGEDPVGYAVGKLENDRDYRIEWVYVPKEERNKKIGTNLVEKMVEFTKDLGCEFIETRVTNNKKEHYKAILKKLNFSITEDFYKDSKISAFVAFLYLNKK